MLRPWKLELQLDVQPGQSLYLRIADAIIKDIQSGRLQPGEALPGSRHLAQQLQLNRNTIVDALNVLIIEGWLVSRERKGTFVADVLPALKQGRQGPAAGKEQQAEGAGFCPVRFDDGHPDSKMAPVAALARAYRQVFNRKARWQMMGYGCELGDPEFRSALVQMLNHQRGMQADTEGLCVTRGSQMAMYLAAQSLLKQGDYVIVENPGYRPAWQALEHAGARLLPVAVDKEGLLTEQVRACLKSRKNIKAIYVTPHRQYPTTVTLSLQRRLELIALSEEYGFTIIEDDYDNEFHFGYRPLLPLCSASLHRYLYIGTMSKVVAPAIRIGYLVSNDHALIRRAGDFRKIIDVQGDGMMEQAVLQLMRDGTLKKHIRKATAYYRDKRDHTASLIDRYLGAKVHYQLPDGGLAFWLEPDRSPADWAGVAAKLVHKGVQIIPPDYYSFDTVVPGLRLGYAALSEAQLTEGIQALHKVL